MVVTLASVKMILVYMYQVLNEHMWWTTKKNSVLLRLGRLPARDDKNSEINEIS